MAGEIAVPRGPHAANEAALRMISADSHVMEPADLWTTRLDRAYRDRAPVFKPRTQDQFQGHPGGHDPRARITEMEQDGVSAEVLYPTLALTLFGLRDAALQAACFRTYNDWLIEYCRAAPGRLVGAAAISLYDVEAGVAELERCRRAGLRGSIIWQVPHPDLPFASPHYDRFWAASQALGMPVSFHILTGFGWAHAGFEALAWQENIKGAVLGELDEAGRAVFDLILNRVLERFPKLSIVLVETEIGWLPWVIEKLDQKLVKIGKAGIGPGASAYSLKPSEYCRRQVHATFFNDPVGTRMLGWWGAENCMWSSDYPHPNSTWPESRAVIARDLGYLDPERRARLAWKNAAALYGID